MYKRQHIDQIDLSNEGFAASLFDERKVVIVAFAIPLHRGGVNKLPAKFALLVCLCVPNTARPRREETRQQKAEKNKTGGSHIQIIIRQLQEEALRGTRKDLSLDLPA